MVQLPQKRVLIFCPGAEILFCNEVFSHLLIMFFFMIFPNPDILQNNSGTDGSSNVYSTQYKRVT